MCSLPSPATPFSVGTREMVGRTSTLADPQPPLVEEVVMSFRKPREKAIGLTDCDQEN